MAGRIDVKEWLEPDKLTLLEGWAKDGLSMDQIAENIPVSRKTLYNWRKKYKPILHALRAGKEVANYAVSNALHRRAVGYRYTEDTYGMIEMDPLDHAKLVEAQLAVFDKKYPKASEERRNLFKLSIPNTKMMLVKQVEKEVPPDTRAMMFYLVNNMPDAYKHESKIEHSGIPKTSVALPPLSVEDLEKLANMDLGDDDE